MFGVSCLHSVCLGGEPAALNSVLNWLNSGLSLLLVCTGVCKSLATWETGPPVGVAKEGDGPASCL